MRDVRNELKEKVAEIHQTNNGKLLMSQGDFNRYLDLVYNNATLELESVKE